MFFAIFYRPPFQHSIAAIGEVEARDADTASFEIAREAPFVVPLRVEMNIRKDNDAPESRPRTASHPTTQENRLSLPRKCDQLIPVRSIHDTQSPMNPLSHGATHQLAQKKIKCDSDVLEYIATEIFCCFVNTALEYPTTSACFSERSSHCVPPYL